MEFRLSYLDPGTKEEFFKNPLAKGKYLFGRGGPNAIFITGPGFRKDGDAFAYTGEKSVTRLVPTTEKSHLEIIVDDNRLTLIDRSTMGTCINDNKIVKGVSYKVTESGTSQIRLGNVLTFELIARE